jgi:hypothetical protein
VRSRLGAGYHLGELAALAWMAAGALIMMKADEGRAASAGED